MHMNAAAKKADALLFDIHYFVYRWRREVDREATAPTTHMTVAKRLRFEALFSAAKQRVAQARLAVRNFWAALG